MYVCTYNENTTIFEITLYRFCVQKFQAEFRIEIFSDSMVSCTP
jgi:hypothetical protein